MKKSSKLLGSNYEPRSQIVKELHRQRFSKFKRRKYVLLHRMDLGQVDLADMTSLHKHNRGFKMFLCLVNCFTKQTYAEPIKTKSKENVLNAFKILIKRSGRFDHIMSDRGKQEITH